jgi:phosphate starvation-inducible PhoH-like protein
MPRKSGTTRTTKTTVKSKVSQKSDEKKQFKLDLLSEIRVDIKYKNELQKKLTSSIKQNDVTICTGPAGTGKTLLSVAEALILLKNNPDKYFDIKLVKSITQLDGEDLGTLPGDANEKLKDTMMSFFDAFYLLIGEDLTNKLIEIGYIKLLNFGAIRGRSLPNTIIIVDEFQNVSDTNAKTFLTRYSENSKIVVLGDTKQIDLNFKKQNTSSLAKLVSMVKTHPEEGVNVIEFTEKEVVRHRLTSYFIKIFEHKDYNKKESKTTSFDKRINPQPKTIKEGGFFNFKKFLSFFR